MRGIRRFVSSDWRCEKDEDWRRVWFERWVLGRRLRRSWWHRMGLIKAVLDILHYVLCARL